MTAAWAGIAMTAQRSGAAAQNGPKRFELLKAKAGSIPIQKAIALHAKNVGHLEGRPNHFSFFRLKLRLMFSVLDRERLSSGLLTACKCRCDRCRYWADVSRSPCPSRTWMVRRSVPASNKWVAQLWRSVCGVTRLQMPARCAASLHAIHTVLSEIGWSRLCWRVRVGKDKAWACASASTRAGFPAGLDSAADHDLCRPCPAPRE